jgi:hypothetical protein
MAARGARLEAEERAQRAVLGRRELWRIREQPAAGLPRLIPLWAWMRLQALLRARRDAV